MNAGMLFERGDAGEVFETAGAGMLFETASELAVALPSVPLVAARLPIVAWGTEYGVLTNREDVAGCSDGTRDASLRRLRKLL